MPIKPFYSPPIAFHNLDPACQDKTHSDSHFGFALHDPRLTALVVEDDLSDIESVDTAWFFSTHQKVDVKAHHIAKRVRCAEHECRHEVPPEPKLSFQILERASWLEELVEDEDGDIQLPLYSPPLSQAKLTVTIPSPVPKAILRKGSQSIYSSSSSTSNSSSGCESPVFYVDEDVDGDDESSCSESATSDPIDIPLSTSDSLRKRRNCFVDANTSSEMEPLVRVRSHEDSVASDEDEEDLHDWVQFAYEPNTFEIALINEALRRRKSDETLEKLVMEGREILANQERCKQAKMREYWRNDMCRWFESEVGEGHELVCG